MTSGRVIINSDVITSGQIDKFVRTAISGGDLIHDARNRLWVVEYGNEKYVVKEFRCSLKNSMIYTFRRSKARRSYDNARCLAYRCGIPTPMPAAYVEQRIFDVIMKRSFYVSKYEPAQSLGEFLDKTGSEGYVAFARFVAKMHDAGVIHGDLNRTNVRTHTGENGDICFSLIDLNRMKIYGRGKKAPLRKCFGDICRFSNNDDNFLSFVDEYVRQRRLGPSARTAAIEAKRTHDRRVDTKKRIKSYFGKSKK